MEKEENQNKEENILKKEDGSDGDNHSEKTFFLRPSTRAVHSQSS